MKRDMIEKTVEESRTESKMRECKTPDKSEGRFMTMFPPCPPNKEGRIAKEIYGKKVMVFFFILVESITSFTVLTYTNVLGCPKLS